MQAPFAEKTIVHGGKQSMPLEYDNSESPYYSEAERTFDTPQDWTTNGADTLSLYFQGRAPGFVNGFRHHPHERHRRRHLGHLRPVPLRL